MVALSGCLTVVANLSLRAGVDRAGGFPGKLADIIPGLLHLGAQPLFDIGVILYAVASLVWFRIVATQPLSSAYPVLVSITFIFVTLGAVVLFREPISMVKLGGIAVILVGIVIISRMG